MLRAKSTFNHTGVNLEGDFLDLETLYHTLFDLVGNEDKYPTHSGVRLRIVSFCYSIRHTLMGERGINLMTNGMSTEKMKSQAIIAPVKNVYYSFNAVWPEILFNIMVLNDYILMEAKRLAQGSNSDETMLAPKVAWDKSIALVRCFQAVVMAALQEILPPSSYTRLINTMSRGYIWFDHYATQYLDMIDTQYMEMDKEKRLKSLPALIKQLVERPPEYYEVERAVGQYAREHNVAIEDVHLAEEDWPEKFEW